MNQADFVHTFNVHFATCLAVFEKGYPMKLSPLCRETCSLSHHNAQKGEAISL